MHTATNMARQPTMHIHCGSPCSLLHLQARSTKAKARVDAFGALQEKARDTPTADLRVDFGRVGMARLGELLGTVWDSGAQLWTL
jgi:hypothetical protein